MRPSCRGRLLVATPLLTEPTFDRTVVLVLEHSEDGALGLVLNRPSDVDLSDPLPDWAPLATPPEVVFVGGPVAPEAVIALAQAESDAEHDAFTPILGAIGSVDLGTDPFEIGIGLRAVRVFSGYAGWGPGQLDRELDVDGWFLADVEIDDLFTADVDGMWRRVLRRHGGRGALFAFYPEDATWN